MPIFDPIAAPILGGVDPVLVARFLKERERYELEILAKQDEVPTLKMLPYNASIDRTLLKSLFYMGKFDKFAADATSVTDLTDDEIKAYIEFIVARSDTAAFDPSIIESALSGFVMQTKITDADARITTYCAEFFERLESVGCGSIPEDNPKKTVRLLCSRLEPPILKKEMRKRLEYDESLEKKVRNFIKVLRQEAINCQAYGSTKVVEAAITKNRGSTKDGTASIDSPNSSSSAKKKPICLYPPHREKGFRPYLKDCKECPNEQKEKLFEDFRAQKKGEIKRTSDKAERTSESSVIFSTMFGNKFRTTICADIGAAASIMDMSMLHKLEKANVHFQIEQLSPARTFQHGRPQPRWFRKDDIL